MGFLVSEAGLEMDPTKVEAVLNWKTPNTKKQLQAFLGFANFYRIFIKNYAVITKPLTKLVGSTVQFNWGSEQTSVFELLKTAFTTAPILRPFNPNLPVIVETDASILGYGCILSNVYNDGPHPCAYISKQFSPTQANWHVPDLEFFAIHEAFRLWRQYLLPCEHKITVLTDHKNLTYYTEKRTLNKRQAEWISNLLDYDFIIKFKKGKLHTKPDVLSRKSESENAYKPQSVNVFQKSRDGSLSLTSCAMALVSGEVLFPLALVMKTVTCCSATVSLDNTEEIEELVQETAMSKTLQDFHSKEPYTKFYDFKDNLLWFRSRIVITSQERQAKILNTRHDGLLGGHYGIQKTLNLVARSYYWPQMQRTVMAYIQRCDTCQKNKPDRTKPYGLLKPLPVPERNWRDVSLDFITDLPDSHGYNAILVVKDRLSKMAHYIPVNKSITAEETAEVYIKVVFKLHGIPATLVSDRGPQFLSALWKRFFELLKCKVCLSSSFHPQSDGSTEVTNQVLEQYIRINCNYLQSDWYLYLAIAEFTYNNTKNQVSNMTPFFANYGFNPTFDPTFVYDTSVPKAEQLLENLAEIQTKIKTSIQEAQVRYTHYANLKRQVSPFKKGDMVLLNTKNIRTIRPVKKFDYKFLGPFEIIKQVNEVAFELALPTEMKIHNVFHASLLKPYKGDVTVQTVLESTENSVQTPIAVLARRFYRNKVQYLIHWQYMDESFAHSWELASSNLEHLISIFEKSGTTISHPIKKGRAIELLHDDGIYYSGKVTKVQRKAKPQRFVYDLLFDDGDQCQVSSIDNNINNELRYKNN
eukprot:Pgem_evm1s7520